MKILKELIVLTLTFLFLTNLSQSQITFQHHYGLQGREQALRAILTNDGGYIIVGATSSYGAGDQDIYMVKVDSAGEMQWTTAIGGPDLDFARSIQQTNDNGYIMVGYTGSYGAGGGDIFLVKTDVSGNVQWAKAFGDPFRDIGYYVKVMNDGGFLLTGLKDFINASSCNGFVIRTDANGDTLWTQTMGGIDWDQFQFVDELSDGNLIFSGRTRTFGAGSSDALIVKTDSNGVIVWQKCYGGTGWEEAYAIKETLDSALIISGRTTTWGPGGSDVYVMKLDLNGDTIWAKSFGETSAEGSFHLSLASDGGYVILGFTESFGPIHLPASGYDRGTDSSHVWLFKLNSAGDTLWSRAYGGALLDEGFFVVETPDRGFLTGGITRSFGLDSLDAFLIKTDSLGVSGCFEKRVKPIVTNCTPQITTVNLTVTRGMGAVSVTPIKSTKPNKDSTLCFNIFISISEPRSGNEIGIYPNPFNSLLKIRTDHAGVNKFILFDIFGRAIENVDLDQYGSLIHTGHYPSGFYFYKFVKDNRVVETGKLIKLSN